MGHVGSLGHLVALSRTTTARSRAGHSIPGARSQEPAHAMCHIAIWRGAPTPRLPCCRPRAIGAPGSGPARRRPPRPPRRLRRCRPRRAGRRRPRRRVSAARNLPLVRLSTSPNRPSAAGTDGGRCGRPTPPTTMLMKWSTVAPLVGASARARWRASEPSPQGYLRTGATPPTAGGGWDTRGYTWCHTPLSPCRASGKKRGVAPVLYLSAGAVRGRRLITKNPNSDGGNWKGCV